MTSKTQHGLISTLSMLVCLTTLLSACAVTPTNLDSLEQDEGQRFTRRTETNDDYQAVVQRFARAGDADVNKVKRLASPYSPTIVFTDGDVIRIRFYGMPEFDGLYQVNVDGEIELPFAESFSIEGHNRKSLIKAIEKELVRLKWFYQDTVKVDVSLVRMAAVNVAVFGAVFNPGRISINNQPIQKQEDAIQQASGAFTSGRDLVAALLAAGGIRPDADVNQIYLMRGESIMPLSLNSLINGADYTKTPSLVNGDTILVKSTGAENSQLIKPSQITPPGMRVFMSNLTAPALNNAQSAVGSDSTRLPYGSSLLDSALSANCIGGTHQANASRSIVLVTRNHGSKRQLVIRRTINQLLASSSDSSVNPYVMPNDGVACYDSQFTNFRDVARGVVEIVSPLFLGGVL